MEISEKTDRNVSSDFQFLFTEKYRDSSDSAVIRARVDYFTKEIEKIRFNHSKDRFYGANAFASDLVDLGCWAYDWSDMTLDGWKRAVYKFYPKQFKHYMYSVYSIVCPELANIDKLVFGNGRISSVLEQNIHTPKPIQEEEKHAA